MVTPRNVCVALAKRESTGRRTFQPVLPRRSCSLRQVLRQEDGGVLLGFSSDGNYLIYCIWRDSYHEVQWRKVKFEDFYDWREDGEPPETVLKLCVDGDSSPYGVSTPLEVWQSADDALVLVITTESLTEDRESSRLCRLAVAPSPIYYQGGRAAAVTSLIFQFDQNAFAQKLEKWQLLQFSRGSGAPKNVYHLLVNVGTNVRVLVLHAWTRRRKVGEEESSYSEKDKPRGLGISHFVQNAWYYPPVFPTKLHEWTEERDYYGVDSDITVGVECLNEHLFDVERLLGEFLETFKPLEHYYLVDYDLRIVRTSAAERTVFMICVIALAPSKVPGNDNLRQISQLVAWRFLGELNGRVIPEPAATSWNNDAVLHEQSLQVLHNPVYPLSISSK